MKNTFVISAFPACGKSYCFENHQDKFSILDSDSSEFSWTKDENGKNTTNRNPNFPQNYIEHIKSNIGKVDVIFVSSHEIVRQALYENDINTIVVYPSKDMKEEFIRRCKSRGNNESFINFISSNWNRFINEIENEDYGFLKHKLNKENPYLDLDFLYALNDKSSGNLSCMWLNS